MTGRGGDGADSAFEGCNTLLKDIRRRVSDSFVVREIIHTGELGSKERKITEREDRVSDFSLLCIVWFNRTLHYLSNNQKESRQMYHKLESSCLPGVDVADRLQGKEVGAVLGAVKDERGRGVDGDSPGIGSRI